MSSLVFLFYNAALCWLAKNNNNNNNNNDVSLGGPVDRVVSDITEISKVGSSILDWQASLQPLTV